MHRIYYIALILDKYLRLLQRDYYSLNYIPDLDKNVEELCGDDSNYINVSRLLSLIEHFYIH